MCENDLKLKCIILDSELQDNILEENIANQKLVIINENIDRLEKKLVNHKIKLQNYYIKRFIEKEQLYAVNIAYHQ
tara:strand:- start:129 stop:356 length:228 start_codon:yes stop_codon:yes gene_type:complete